MAASSADDDPSEAAGIPEAQSKPRWKLLVIAAGIAVVVIVVAVILAISITNAVSVAQRDAASEAAEASRLKLLSSAVEDCGVGAEVVQDEGKSAFLDNKGTDFGSGDLTTADLVCVLNGLNTPDAVINHMSQTRSLDGTQSDTWEDFSATWTYHPDNGLDVIIKLTED